MILKLMCLKSNFILDFNPLSAMMPRVYSKWRRRHL